MNHPKSPLEMSTACQIGRFSKFNPIRIGAVLWLTAICATPLGLAQTTWTNAAGGNYSQTTNWSNGNIPATGNSVYFDATGAPATYTVQFSGNVNILGTNTGRFFSSAGDDVTLKLRDGASSHSLTLFGLQPSAGTFTLDGGTTLATTVVAIGSEGSGTLKMINGATLNVTAAGDFFRLGGTTSGGQSALSVSGTSVITSASRINIGFASNANKVTVTGTGSQLNSSRGIYLGSSTETGALASSSNTLIIQAGAHATITNNTNLYLGYLAGASSNTVVVEGLGSQLTVANIVRIGLDATSANNSITVKDGAEFSATGLFQISAGSGNEFRIANGGKATFTNTSATNVIRGSIVVDEGELAAGSLRIQDTGVVTFKGGKFNLSSNLVADAGSRFGFSLDEEVTINIAGTFTANGPIYIDIIDILSTAPGEYALFSFGGQSGINATNLILGNRPDGFEGNLVFGANSLLLNVIAVPEPGAFLLLLAGSLGLAIGRMRTAEKAKA